MYWQVKSSLMTFVLESRLVEGGERDKGTYIGSTRSHWSFAVDEETEVIEVERPSGEAEECFT